MRYAVIDADLIVINVVECDPDNLCTEADSCGKWHPPEGTVCVPAGEGPNTADPRTRPAGPGDRAVKLERGARSQRPYAFEPAPDPEPVSPELTI